MTAEQFDGHSRYIGEVFNGCEIIGYQNRTSQFLMRCLKCNSTFVRNRATVVLQKAKCDCSKTKKVHHTDGFCGTKIRSVYMSMLDRCNNPRSHAYQDYGGRGIKVCLLWEQDFREFYKWAIENGYEKGLTLDRIDNNGDYSPDNCRWASRKTQANNRRSNVMVLDNGTKCTIAQLSEKTGINYNTLYSRIRSGKYECV